MNRLTRVGTAEPVSLDQILKHERGQGNTHFPCSTDHEQDWQPYPVDPYSCYMCDHTYIQIVPRNSGALFSTGKKQSIFVRSAMYLVLIKLLLAKCAHAHSEQSWFTGQPKVLHLPIITQHNNNAVQGTIYELRLLY